MTETAGGAAAPAPAPIVIPAAAKSDLDTLRSDFTSLETHVKTAIESRLSSLETAASSRVTEVKSWFAKEWPHVVTWLSTSGLAAAVFIAKHA